MKTYAIEVFFEENFDRYVRDLWEQCEVHNLSSFMNQVKGTEPHTALALFENIEVVGLRTCFKELVSQELEGFELLFDAVACFPVTKVTYLQPNSEKKLVSLLEVIHERFKEYKDKVNLYYSPKRWFPHVTVAKNRSNDEMIISMGYIIEQFTPQRTRVDRLVLVEIEYTDKGIVCRNIESTRFTYRD